MEELKAANPDFPAVSSGIYVQEVVPNSPSQRYALRAGAGLLSVRHGGRECWGLDWASLLTLCDPKPSGKELWSLAGPLNHWMISLSEHWPRLSLAQRDLPFEKQRLKGPCLGQDRNSKPPSLQKEPGPQFSFL